MPTGTSLLCGRTILSCSLYLSSSDGTERFAISVHSCDQRLLWAWSQGRCLHTACLLVCVQGCCFLKIEADTASDSVPFTSCSFWYICPKSIDPSLIPCYLPGLQNLRVSTERFTLSFINSWKLVSCESEEIYIFFMLPL